MNDIKNAQFVCNDAAKAYTRADDLIDAEPLILKEEKGKTHIQQGCRLL